MDWLAMVLTVIQMWLVYKKSKWNFLFGALGTIIWMYINFSLHIWGGLAMNVIVVALSIAGFHSWTKEQHNAKKD